MKNGRIKSRRASRSAKTNKNLKKAGWTFKKGEFGAVRVDGKDEVRREPRVEVRNVQRKDPLVEVRDELRKEIHVKIIVLRFELLVEVI